MLLLHETMRKTAEDNTRETYTYTVSVSSVFLLQIWNISWTSLIRDANKRISLVPRWSFCVTGFSFLSLLCSHSNIFLSARGASEVNNLTFIALHERMDIYVFFMESRLYIQWLWYEISMLLCRCKCPYNMDQIGTYEFYVGQTEQEALYLTIKHSVFYVWVYAQSKWQRITRLSFLHPLWQRVPMTFNCFIVIVFCCSRSF